MSHWYPPGDVELFSSSGYQTLILHTTQYTAVYVEPARYTLEDTYASVHSDLPSHDWKEAEQIAKDEHAKKIVDEMNRV